MTIRDLAIQKRDREMAIGTYGRGFYVADIGPIKEFKPEVFQEAAHLFDIKNTIKWNRFERRGETLGEMVKADNPPVGANIYYYLKADAQNVKMTIKDLEGNTVQELTPTAKKGLQKVFWNLTRPVPGASGGRGGAGGGQGAAGAPAVNNPISRPRRQAGAAASAASRRRTPGVYKVTLTVDGKDVETKKMTVSPDPAFK